MTNLQNPNIPPPTVAVEIDKAIYNLQMKLDMKLDWLTHSYGRAYRHMEKKEKKLYFPEIYIGEKQYHRVTPDSEKKGMLFFVVGKEQDNDFETHQHNYLTWDVGIIFWVNLELINAGVLSTEIFTQNLIKDVRHILTMQLGGIGFGLKIKDVVRELNEIYKEFTLSEDEEYLRAPYSGFRFNVSITLQEECGDYMFDSCNAIKQNLSKNEINNCVVPIIDFTSAINFLTPEQINVLQNHFQPNLNSTGSRVPAPIPVIQGQTPWLDVSANCTQGVGMLTKSTGVSGYDTSGYFAVSTLGDFEVEFRLDEFSSGGVSNNQAGVGYQDIDFSFYKNSADGNMDGQWVIFEKGINKASGFSMGDGDPLFKIKRDGWFIEYYVNGVQVHTSYFLFTNPNTQGFMLFDTSIFTVGKTIRNILLNYL